jgi:hypothetical protein
MLVVAFSFFFFTDCLASFGFAGGFHGDFGEKLSGVDFKNSKQPDVSIADAISFTKQNRCIFYPRCLLFDCCKESLKNAAISYFINDGTTYPEHVPCISTHRCNKFKLSLSDRLEGLPIMNITLTRRIVNDIILLLPPTSAKELKYANSRSEFRVIYLVQGDYQSKMEPCYNQLVDLLYLSFKEMPIGAIFI